METLDQFCEGFIGGKIGNPLQRDKLFDRKSLIHQYVEISYAMVCNRKRGAISQN